MTQATIRIRNTSKRALEFAVRTNPGEKVTALTETGVEYEKDAAPLVEVIHIPAMNGTGCVEISKAWFDAAMDSKMEVAEIIYEQQELEGVTLDKKPVTIDVAIETGRRVFLSAMEIYLRDRTLEVVREVDDNRAESELLMIQDLRDLGLNVADGIASDTLARLHARIVSGVPVVAAPAPTLKPAAEEVAAPTVPVKQVTAPATK